MKQQEGRARLKFWAAGGAGAIVAATLYLPTLKLPLIYDTLLHFRIAEDLDWLSVWLPTTAFGFYRPLVFLPFIFLECWFDSIVPAWTLHALNVGQHALNAALLGWLVLRLWGDWRQGALAGIFLALFPFSYPAVAVFGNNVHLAITTLMLLGVFVYLSWLDSGGERKSTLFWVWLIFIIGIFTNEFAVLFGGFALLTAWQRKIWLPKSAFAFILAGAFYAGIYQFFPITRAPQAIEPGFNLTAKALYLGQTFAYPVSWLTHRIPGIPVPSAVAVAVGLMALWISWSARQREARLPLLWGLGWFGAVALLLALTLPKNYLFHGSRLLYLGSVGLAVCVALLVSPPQQPENGGRRNFLSGALFLSIFASNALFVLNRLDAYARLTSVVEVAQANYQPGSNILWVNLPQWLAPPRNSYPVGAEYVAMLGDHLFVEELTGANGLPREARAIVVPDLMRTWEYGYGLHTQHQPADVAFSDAPWQLFVVDMEEGGAVTARNAGMLRPNTAAQPIAHFGAFQLLAASGYQCGGEIRLQLEWRLWEQAVPTSSVFAQAFSGTELVAQLDQPPLGLPPNLLGMPIGWEMSETRLMPASSPGDSILVGVYDFVTGERYSGVDPDGAPLADNGYRIEIEQCPE